MSVRLVAKLPKDERDGLASLESRLVANPGGTVWVVAQLVHAATEERFDSDDEHVVKLAVEAIEPIGDSGMVREILDEAFEARTGRDRLSFAEQADEEVFGLMPDPETGESG